MSKVLEAEIRKNRSGEFESLGGNIFFSLQQFRANSSLFNFSMFYFKITNMTFCEQIKLCITF